MVGLWAGSAYVPSSITYLARREGFSPPDAARLASWATMLLSAGTIAGSLMLPALADWLGVKDCHEILVQLQAITGDDRYRPSQWLRRRAMLGMSATTPE